MKKIIILVLIMTSLLSCKIVNKKEYLDNMKTEREVNTELFTASILEYFYNFLEEDALKIINIEMKLPYVKAVFITESTYFYYGKIKLNDKIIDLTDQNYQSYINQLSQEDYDIIKNPLIYNDKEYGEVTFYFTKL